MNESKDAPPKPKLLMSREQSTMVSSWNEMLGVEELKGGKWRIGVFGYKVLESIYDLLPEDQLYNEDGEIKVPTEWDGQKIRGLADGEYLETEELMSANEDSEEFYASSLQVALDYCRRNGWDQEKGFQEAWDELTTLVGQKPSERNS